MTFEDLDGLNLHPIHSETRRLGAPLLPQLRS